MYLSLEGRLHVQADRFREVTVVQRRRVCASFYDCIMNYCIYGIRCDPGFNMGSSDVKNFTSELFGQNGMSHMEITLGENTPDRRFSIYSVLRGTISSEAVRKA